MYDDIVWYDTVTHLAASITIALLVFYALVAVELFDKETRFGKRIPLFVTLIMMTFSIYWEVLELVVDYTTGINMQYSPWDTIRDMVCNTIGTLMVTIPLRFYLKKHDPIRVHRAPRAEPFAQAHRHTRTEKNQATGQ